MTPDEILDRAADVMTERGKATGVYVDPEGRVCALGAMYVASGVKPEEVSEVLSNHSTEMLLAQHWLADCLEPHYLKGGLPLFRGDDRIAIIAAVNDHLELQKKLDMPEEMRLAAKSYREETQKGSDA